MGRQAETGPGDFAKAVAREFRREAGDRRLSGRAVASAIDKSEKYVRDRLNDTLSFTLNDVELFARHIGYSPEEFVARIERDLAPSNVTPMPKRDVPAPVQTDRKVAKKKSRDPGGDEGDF